MFTVTAPGADVLPWDEVHCERLGPHVHSGLLGCKVRDDAAFAWSLGVQRRWGRLHQAAAIATRRQIGGPWHKVASVWEPQKRGVAHIHPVVLDNTWADRVAADAYFAHLQRLAPSHGFGLVHKDEIQGDETARQVAAYLSSYFVGGKKEKATLRANVNNPLLPCRLLHVNPKYTQAAGISMRLLRKVRRYWAFAAGLTPLPDWTPSEWLSVLQLSGTPLETAPAQGP